MSEGQPKESAKAYQAFVAYCELGSNRSLRNLAESNQKYSKSIALLMKWSAQYDWQERVKQYDAEQLAERNASRRKQREEMEARHAAESREEQEAARRYILTIIDPGEHPQDHISDDVAPVSVSAERINIGAIVQLLKNSRDDERKALGVEKNQALAVEVSENENDDNVRVIVYYPQAKDE